MCPKSLQQEWAWLFRGPGGQWRDELRARGEGGGNSRASGAASSLLHPSPKGGTETWGDLSCLVHPTPAISNSLCFCFPPTDIRLQRSKTRRAVYQTRRDARAKGRCDGPGGGSTGTLETRAPQPQPGRVPCWHLWLCPRARGFTPCAAFCFILTLHFE